MDENRIIHLARGGDPDAFCQLYDQYKDRLYRYAVYKLGSRQDAEDAVSECVLSAYRQIRNLKDAKAFPAWIFRILTVICKKQIAQKIKERENPYAAEAPEPVGDPAETAVLRTDLQRALSELSAEEREIVLLSLVAGFTSNEIAQITGSRSGTVRSKQSRSLAKMRAYLEEEKA